MPEPRLTLPKNALTLVLLFCCATCFPPASCARHAQHSQQTTVELDLVGYEAELDRCAAALKHPNADEISQLRKSLPRAWVVRTGDEQIEVSTEWLTSRLHALGQDPAKPALREIELHLSAMRRAATEMENGATRTFPTDAREHLEEILQGREFAGLHGPSLLEIWEQRAIRWIAEKIFHLLSRLHIGAKAGNMLAWIVVGLAFLALCAWALRSLSSNRRALPIAPDAPLETIDSRVWAKEALAAAERGDYREAVHCAYWAMVVRLEVLGLLKRDRARTPREALRLLDPHPNEQKLLRDFTGHFELIWYGYRPASAQDWSDARMHLEKMGCLTPSTPATANS
jgi:Domain of unknown function (DUF4129)